MVQIHQKIIMDVSVKLFPKPERTHFLYFILWGVLNFFENLSDRVSTNLAESSNSLIVTSLISIIFAIVIIYLLIRAYFVFPMIAIREELNKLVRISDNEGWRILKANLFTFIPAIIIAWVLLIVVIIIFANIESTKVGSKSIYSDISFIMLFYLKFFFLLLLNTLYSLMYIEFRKNKFT